VGDESWLGGPSNRFNDRNERHKVDFILLSSTYHILQITPRPSLRRAYYRNGLYIQSRDEKTSVATRCHHQKLLGYIPPTQ
jgi:hypothetical protein